MIAHTKIGPTISIGGDITAREELIIEGSVSANNINVDGFPLIIGRSANVQAQNISAKHITIFGTVNGNITASESIHLGATSRVIGDLKAPKIHIDDLSYLEGRMLKGG